MLVLSQGIMFLLTLLSFCDSLLEELSKGGCQPLSLKLRLNTHGTSQNPALSIESSSVNPHPEGDLSIQVQPGSAILSSSTDLQTCEQTFAFVSP